MEESRGVMGNGLKDNGGLPKPSIKTLEKYFRDQEVQELIRKYESLKAMVSANVQQAMAQNYNQAQNQVSAQNYATQQNQLAQINHGNVQNQTDANAQRFLNKLENELYKGDK